MATALAPSGPNHRWSALAVLAVLTAIRLGVAAAMPLAPDEAYYWVWSRALAGGFYDHPPMVAVWIAAGCAIMGDTALGVRLLGPLAAALGTVLLADAAERLIPGRNAGVVAGALFNATLMMGVGSVVMTPDSPLLLFWVATLWALTRVAIDMRSAQAEAKAGARAGWVAAGLFGGLALASKYTAAFLGVGIACWLMLTPAIRPWLLRPWPWLGLLAALAAFSPVIMWNVGHDWAGFLRQGGRVASWNPGRALQFQAELIGGQAGLATPLVWALSLGGMGLAASRAWRSRDPGWSLLAWLSVPAAAYMVWYALGARVQGNWPAVIYPAALVAAAGLASFGWVRLIRPAIVLGLVITGLTYLHAASGAVRLPIAVDPIALRLADWDRVAAHVEVERRRVGANFVASDQYALAAAMAWILPRDVAVLGVEDRWRLFDLPAGRVAGQAGLLVRDSRDRTIFDPALWRSVEKLSEVSRTDVQTLHVFLVVAVGDHPTIVRLPRPGGS